MTRSVLLTALLAALLMVNGAGMPAFHPDRAAQDEIIGEIDHFFTQEGAFIVGLVYRGAQSTTDLTPWQTVERNSKRKASGIKFILVNGADAKEQCADTNWSADATLCDTDGRIGKMLGVDPQSIEGFFWSWRGTLFLKESGPKEADKAIARAIRGRLRLAVKVDTSSGPRDTRVQREVRAALSGLKWLHVVAGGQLRERLRALKEESYGPEFNEAQQVEMGASASANALLLVTMEHRGPVSLEIYDVRQGVLLASLDEPGLSSRHVGMAVRKLLTQLRQPLEVPRLTRAKKAAPEPLRDEGQWKIPQALRVKVAKRQRLEEQRRLAEEQAALAAAEADAHEPSGWRQTLGAVVDALGGRTRYRRRSKNTRRAKVRRAPPRYRRRYVKRPTVRRRNPPSRSRRSGRSRARRRR